MIFELLAALSLDHESVPQHFWCHQLCISFATDSDLKRRVAAVYVGSREARNRHRDPIDRGFARPLQEGRNLHLPGGLACACR
jgi:hypothetical protein